MSLWRCEEQWRAISLYHERGIDRVVLSLGSAGALVSGGDGDRFHVIPPSIEEVNAVGSGDALVAGFAIGRATGMSLRDTARLACAMGAANALSWDIGHFTRDEVDALLEDMRIEEPSDM